MKIEDLTETHKQFLEGTYVSKKEVEGIVIKKHDTKYIEYGDKLHTIIFNYKGEKYELNIVFEDGPGTWDWIGHNAAAEGVSLEKVIPKEIEKNYKKISEKMLKAFETILECESPRDMYDVAESMVKKYKDEE